LVYAVFSCLSTFLALFMGGAAFRTKKAQEVTICNVSSAPVATVSPSKMPAPIEPAGLFRVRAGQTDGICADFQCKGCSGPDGSASAVGKDTAGIAEVNESAEGAAEGRLLWAKLFRARDVAESHGGFAPNIAPQAQVHSPASADDPQTAYARVCIVEPVGEEQSDDVVNAAARLLRCLEIRNKYVMVDHVEATTTKHVSKQDYAQAEETAMALVCPESRLRQLDGNKRILWEPFAGVPPKRYPGAQIFFKNGIFSTKDAADVVILGGWPEQPSLGEFCRDYIEVMQTMNDRDCATLAYPRLRELELKFEIYKQRNASREGQRQRRSSGRDWFQVRKVDTHIHHSACFSQGQLMGFIRAKMRTEMDTLVAKGKDRNLTLREVFNTAGVGTEDDVNADFLCCAASIGAGGNHDTFQRFDKFNSKYNPFGDKQLRDVFLKTDNLIDGRFLAELTKEVMADLTSARFVMAEWRISIYGKSREEWAKLAKWFRKYDVQCSKVRWVIQVPRLYSLFRKLGNVESFADVMRNVFEPLFEATLDPSTHEDMFHLLQQVVAFDSVDDESQGSHTTLREYPDPEEWTSEQNPPYTYWIYFMYANIRALNSFRRHTGLNTFAFRPHCGEAGNVSHLCSGFMLAEGICHGIQLDNSKVMQYLFYLAQVGLAVSPLSNDILFVELAKSPFGKFFKRGLNVSLSTDDPLIIHMTDNALIEEYCTAARAFKLSNADLCEIARNSVLQSGFERLFKEWWIGTTERFGVEANGEMKSNVPTIRVQFRADNLRDEMEMLNSLVAGRRV